MVDIILISQISEPLRIWILQKLLDIATYDLVIFDECMLHES